MRTTYKALLLLVALWTVPAMAQDNRRVRQKDAGQQLETLLQATTQTAAQARSQTQALMQFAANNTAFDAKVEDTGKTLFRRQVESCKTLDRAVRQLPTPYGNLTYPPDVPGFPAPSNGLWAEHVKVLGCGKLWQINMLAIGRREKDGPMLMALLPGETLADPGSQRTAERMGATTIRKADTSCADDAKTSYTRLLGYKQPDGTIARKDAGEGWFEEWSYRFCQKIIPVQMAFVPDGSGGFEIKARLADISAPKTPVAKPAGPAAPAVTAPAAPARPSESPAPPSESMVLTPEHSVPPQD